MSISSDGSENPIIGSNSATWRCKNGCFVRTTTAPMGAQVPCAAGVYILCAHTNQGVKPLFIDESFNLADRLNDALFYHPSIRSLINNGANTVCYVCSKSAEERKELVKLLVNSLQPIYRRKEAGGLRKRA